MIVFQHPIVLIIHDIEIARGVHCHSRRIVEAVGAEPRTCGQTETAARTEDTVGVGVGGKWSVVLQHPPAVAIGDIHVARPIDGDS